MSAPGGPKGEYQMAQPEGAQVSTEGHGNTLRIEGEFTIYRASDLCGELLNLMRQPGDLTLDLSQVSEMDSAGVQLLLAAQSAARETERTLRVDSASEAVQEVLQTLGMNTLQGELRTRAAA